MLRDAVQSYVTRRYLDLVIETDAGNGRLLANLREWGEVSEVRYEEGKAVIDVAIASRYVDRIRQSGGTVVSGASSEPSQ